MKTETFPQPGAETLPGTVPALSNASAPSETPAVPLQTAQAAESLKRVMDYVAPTLTAADMVQTLRETKARDGDGEAMLFNQSLTLDSLFHRLAATAVTGKYLGGQPIPEYVNETKIDLALRTQKLCRGAIESMAFLKHMKTRGRWG